MQNTPRKQAKVRQARSARQAGPLAHRSEVDDRFTVRVQRERTVERVVVKGPHGTGAAADGFRGQVQVLTDVSRAQVEMTVPAISGPPGGAPGHGAPDEGDRAGLYELLPVASTPARVAADAWSDLRPRPCCKRTSLGPQCRRRAPDIERFYWSSRRAWRMDAMRSGPTLTRSPGARFGILRSVQSPNSALCLRRASGLKVAISLYTKPLYAPIKSRTGGVRFASILRYWA